MFLHREHVFLHRKHKFLHRKHKFAGREYKIYRESKTIGITSNDNLPPLIRSPHHLLAQGVEISGACPLDDIDAVGSLA